MSEVTAHLASPDDARLDALAKVAAMLEWPLPRERDEAVCAEAAHTVDRLLAPIARGPGAVDIAIGGRLDLLSVGDRVLRLGYSGIGDYARERVGIAASTARKMARLARELRDRPIVRLAVQSGEMSVRQAEAVLPVARGDAEASWVARARVDTVRGLKVAVKNTAAPDPEEDEEDEEFERLSIPVSAEARPDVDEGLAHAKKALGKNPPKWQRYVALCQEFLSVHPPPDDGGGGDPLLTASAKDSMEPIKEALEQQSAQWAFLGQPPPVAAPAPSQEAEDDPWLLDQELRHFSAIRTQRDAAFGHLALHFRSLEGWRYLGFASLEHYCCERLGMAERTVQQRIALERKLHDFPSLRQALHDGRVSYEKARLIARHATKATVDGLIDRAGQMTCIELRRDLEEKEEVQMCAKGKVELVAPRRVVALLDQTFRAAREAAGRSLLPGECLRMIARHFTEVWKPILAEPNTLQKQVLARDKGFCQVPGCSRAAEHAHHIDYRSAGGADEAGNLISLCAAHHLHGVHKGYIRVSGEAPHGLRWQLGVRLGKAPLVEVVTALPTTSR